MASQRGSGGMSGHHRNDMQGECDPVLEHQLSKTELSNDAPTQTRVADHPNRRSRVIQTDSSYTPPKDPHYVRPILPSQVEAVIHAPADQADRVIDQVRSQEKSLPPASSENGLHADPRHIHSASRDDHGQSANARQDLLDRGSGISLDGSPNRSVEEGGVSGLSQRGSGQTGGNATGADAPSISSSSGSAEPSGSTVDDALLHTARAVTIVPFRAGRPRDEGLEEHRLPSPPALDRLDALSENVTMAWADVPSGTVAQTRVSEEEDEDEERVLTGNRETNTTPLGHMGNAEGHRVSVSPTPSDSSITETVFNVRRPTPPPRRPDTASLPSSRKRAAAVAGPSGGLRRGPSYFAASDVGQQHQQEEAEPVPAVLVPGGLLLGLGGSNPHPPQVSHRQHRREARRE